MHTLIVDFLFIQEHKLRGVPTNELDFKLWPIGLRLKKTSSGYKNNNAPNGIRK